ncbi:type II secretion system minor pseudopilin GspH [Vibrio aphrogenes]|uniref:type II secretion system minor pseudopilin GspH n=1 Tax=Vibrio aphrogenes TaxID=1891186 RepID=UPI000B361A96|nr:type II secretion system minor pseudopilin GspH [Vibrio aphrogenes]
MQRQRGFTLLEVLLVVVLMSLSALVVVQTLPQNKEDQAKEQSQRFFQRLQLLSDEAMLSGQDYGLFIDTQKSHYHYMTLTQKGWEIIQESRYFVATDLPDEVSLNVELGSEAWNHKDSLFKQESFYADLFEDDEDKAQPPQVYVLSSGEITPFTLGFMSTSNQNITQSWRVQVTETGEVHILAPGEVMDETP